MTIDDIRKIVAVACEYRASVHIAFKGGGEIHVDINPADERNGNGLDDAATAPTPLKGEQATATAVPVIHGEPLESLTVTIDSAEVQRIIDENIQRALAEYHDQQRRGGFSTDRSRYESRQG